MSPAELLFSFSWEIKSIVSTLGPNLSDLKRIAYATWWLQQGMARSDPSICTGVSLNHENPHQGAALSLTGLLTEKKPWTELKLVSRSALSAPPRPAGPQPPADITSPESGKLR